MLVLSTVALVIFHGLAARMGVVTGQGLIGLVRQRYGVRLGGAVLAALVIANVGTGVRMDLDELAETARAAGRGPEVEITHVEVHRAGDIDHACADMTHAWSLGMPRPRLTSQEAIADFISHSWDLEAADPRLWDRALEELTERGLAES